MVKKIILRGLLVLGFLVVLALIMLPGIAKRYAVKHSKELIGRQIQIDKLRLNYFTGMIRITDFVMFEADEKEKFVSFDTLTIHLKPFQLFKEELVMNSFYLKGLESKVVLEDSTFNFDDLIAFYTSDEDTARADTAAPEQLRFHLSNIEIKDARFIFDDKDIGKVTDLKNISFFIPYIGWNQEEKSEAGLRFSFAREGYFEAQMNVDPIGGDYDAEIIINHLYLNYFKEYVASYMNINNIEGIFDASLSITGNINVPEHAIVSGRAEIDDFELYDSRDKKFLGTKGLTCVIKELDAAKMSLVIDSFLIVQPYVYFEMDTVTNNFFEAFNITSDTLETEELAQAAPDADTTATDTFYYAVNYILIDDGITEYRDNLTGEPFDYYLSEIRLESDSIESTSDWVDLYSTMMLNKRGTLKAQVGFNPANPMDIRLDYVITDFMLSDLNIYSRFYMGFPIVYGDMYYKSETEIMNGLITSENKLIMTNVELGEKSGGLYDLPMKFALFLLKDRNGVITLDVPVRGDLNDPTVRLGKIIWNTFKNLIIKIAASPFDLLAGVIGVDPKDIQEISFDYGDTTLTAGRQKQLDLLLELEQKKQGLEIELMYFNDQQKEKEALAVAEAGRQYTARTSKDYKEDEEGFMAYLAEKAGSDSVDIAQVCLKLADPALLDTLVDTFNKYRYERVKQYLTMANDSTRIITSVSNPSAPKNVGSLPVFEVKYSMKNPEEEEGREE